MWSDNPSQLRFCFQEMIPQVRARHLHCSISTREWPRQAFNCQAGLHLLMTTLVTTITAFPVAEKTCSSQRDRINRTYFLFDSRSLSAQVATWTLVVDGRPKRHWRQFGESWSWERRGEKEPWRDRQTEIYIKHSLIRLPFPSNFPGCCWWDQDFNLEI